MPARFVLLQVFVLFNRCWSVFCALLLYFDHKHGFGGSVYVAYFPPLCVPFRLQLDFKLFCTWPWFICVVFAGPLLAVIDAQAQAGVASYSYVSKAGFAANGSANQVTFNYEAVNSTGNKESKTLTVPLLTLLPIPYIKVRPAVASTSRGDETCCFWLPPGT